MLQCIRTISISVECVHDVLFNVQINCSPCILSPLTPHSSLQSASATMSVKSKNLFNFPPQGFYDEDVAAFMAQQQLMMKELFGEDGPLFK